MVVRLLKRAAGKLPAPLQHELRRLFFRGQIRRHRFRTDEKEYELLDRFLSPGDWVLDVGANVGHYTMRMSELVGARGRVIAFEPVPDTFALLAANARMFTHANVSLLNVAASEHTAAVGVSIPQFSEGLPNFYQAHLSPGNDGLVILSLSIDALAIPAPIRLVKIDVEGHELPVLRGMRQLLERDHPLMIVETGSRESVEFLHSFGYSMERLPDSSNLLCRAEKKTTGTTTERVT